MREAPLHWRDATLYAITMQGITHPINDPALVSYHRPELVRLLPRLEQAHDCWTLLNPDGTDEVKKKYLAKEPAEPEPAYRARLDRSTYAPIYRDAIKSYAGLLSRFQLIEPPQSMLDNIDNVDLAGSSIQSFMTGVDEKTLRDGGSYVMVDMMPEGEADNFFDQLSDGRHPYFISINRADVVNWSVRYDGGQEIVEHATVRQLRSKPNPDGQFGAVIEPVYFVLTPGRVEQYELVRVGPKRWENRLVDSVATSLPIVPIAWYGASSTRFAEGELPLSGLADLSIQHFQMRSDLGELLHKCAMPVPVRKGAPVGPDGKPAPLIIGPNTAVDLSAEGGDFKFAEPTGMSLQRHQAEVEHVEELMDRSSLNFLYGANIKTATEASLRASQVASSVSALVRNKTSMFGHLMRLWAWYAGEQSQVTKESGLAINDSLINKPLGASEMAQLVNLHSTGLLSKVTVLDELQRGGILDPDLNIEDELERIQGDKDEKVDEQEEFLDRQQERADQNPESNQGQTAEGPAVPKKSPSEQVDKEKEVKKDAP
jgi:hypothetical protein